MEEKEAFWTLLETEFIKDPKSTFKGMAKKYELAHSTVFRQGKRRRWRAKKEEWAATIEKGESPSPMSVGQDRRSIFSSFVESNLHGIAFRTSEVLLREKRQLRTPDPEDKSKTPRMLRVDTIVALMERIQALGGLMRLGMMVYGPPEPAMPPEVNYEAVIMAQRVTHKVVDRLEERPPIEIEVVSTEHPGE